MLTPTQEQQLKSEYFKYHYENRDSIVPADIADFFIKKLNTALEEREKELVEEKEELLSALEDMYVQYCSNGHDFMSAGEFAQTQLQLHDSYIITGDCGEILNKED